MIGYNGSFRVDLMVISLKIGLAGLLTTTRKLAIGGRLFCGTPKWPCATENILWRTVGGAPQNTSPFCGAFLAHAPLNYDFLWRTSAHAPQKICGPHHQRMDCIRPLLFCGAWTHMRHRNAPFCGASNSMRHRKLHFCGAC